MTTFVDRVLLRAAGGNGGHGRASIRREKFKPLAGPDGANGGRGGDVILEVDASSTTPPATTTPPTSAHSPAASARATCAPAPTARTSSCPCPTAPS